MQRRSVVLTTHSMEEADALCSRIGIMVNGELQCIGTSQRLKDRFGGGYEIELHAQDSMDDCKSALVALQSLLTPGDRHGRDAVDVDVQVVGAAIARASPRPNGTSGFRVLEQFGGKTRVSITKETLVAAQVPLSRLFEAMELQRQRGSLSDFSISQTTYVKHVKYL